MCSERARLSGVRRRRNRIADTVDMLGNVNAVPRAFARCLALAAFAVAIASVSGCVTFRCDGVAAFGNLGPAVNSPYDDYAPALPDTATLVITSNRIVPGRGGLHEHGRGDRPTFLFSSMRLTASWDEALPYALLLGARETEGGTIAFAPAGSPFATLAYVSACYADGSVGGCDLYAVTAGDRPAVVNLGPDVNSALWEGQPYVTYDGKRLYFASERAGGIGKSDIWYAERQSSGTWGPPQNAGPVVNTTEDEVSPFMDPATNRLYFASVIPGRGRELFVMDEGGGQRFVLPAPFNSESDDFTPFLSGGRLYLASNRAGGCGGYDVYGFPAPIQ